MPPAVSVRALVKRYGDLTALDGVTFDVEEGECVAVLGPNGAGKSTLFSILATLRRPDDGGAHVAGHSVSQDPGAVRRALGVVFQEPLVAKHLTAREVLLHHAKLYGVPSAEAVQHAVELLDFVDLADRADEKTAGFSGGMRRRLDLARVLVTDPHVLLLDEPTAGLDLRGRQEIQARVRELVNEGTSVLLATHDLDEAHRLAHRVALLDRGRLIAFDTPSRLARRLGRRVVRVELAIENVAAARKTLSGAGDVVDTGDGLEVLLGAEEVSAGHVIDALDGAGVVYDRVTVREPDLGDVFLGLTGRDWRAADDAATEDAGVEA